ncbi:MAG: hypothetical protein M3N18_10135 [Actinomycetota bacterium]|nr:hypothetical protein [Actinomycetota bacterium]
MALLVVLGLAGLASVLVGLSWDAGLRAFATDLARSENAFNLINPDHIFFANGVVAVIVNLGRILLALGMATTITVLAGAAHAYLRSRGNPRYTAPGFRRGFVGGTVALVLLAVGIAWATSADPRESLATASSGSAGNKTSSSSHNKGHNHDCTEPPTPRQQEAADNLATETEESVAKYADPSGAEADGYQPISPDWRPITHHLNPAYQRDGEILDPGRPEALLYANTSKGPVLLGAMYLMPEPGTPGSQIGGCLTQWHAHSLLGWETPQMMHVWTVDVPGGPFSDELRPRELVPLLEG